MYFRSSVPTMPFISTAPLNTTVAAATGCPSSPSTSTTAGALAAAFCPSPSNGPSAKPMGTEGISRVARWKHSATDFSSVCMPASVWRGTPCSMAPYTSLESWSPLRMPGMMLWHTTLRPTHGRSTSAVARVHSRAVEAGAPAVAVAAAATFSSCSATARVAASVWGGVVRANCSSNCTLRMSCLADLAAASSPPNTLYASLESTPYEKNVLLNTKTWLRAGSVGLMGGTCPDAMAAAPTTAAS
mmetsp:Transcript_39785/g.78378  ORF Transcript_39785/g.78378 Transcript_39785/m.78378 type:complete len:244 (-) Transcript_39785:39-770(-)